MVEGTTPALNRSRETRALTQSGYLMLLIWAVLLGIAVWAGVSNATAEYQVARHVRRAQRLRPPALPVGARRSRRECARIAERF